MKIAFIAQHFGKGLGYIENAMPRHLARLGADVDLITLDLSPYFPTGPHSGGAMITRSELSAGLVERYDGYTLRVLPHRMTLGYPRPLSMLTTLRDLKPDIVQTISAIGWIPLEAAVARPLLRYKLFTGSHTHASHFPLAQKDRSHPPLSVAKSFLTRWVPGRLASLATEKCYGQTNDSAEVAWRFFGVQRRKVETMHLGVETDLFHPADSTESRAERDEIRKLLAFAPDDIVCINTGKLSHAKNALVIADAVAELRQKHGLPFKGLFIGEGEQRDALAAREHCVVIGQQVHFDLAKYYRASDVGVWPTTESVSTLDAAACGLPLVIGDVMRDRGHVEGNGLVCRTNDVADLVRAMLELKDASIRTELGARGAAKMLASFSWASMAARRMDAYRTALAA